MVPIAEVGSAFVSILPSARGFGRSLDGQIGSGVAASGKKAGGVWGKMFKITAGLAIGAKAISFLGDSISEGREAEKVAALTEQRIKTMGNVAGISADGVAKLAEAISKKTGIDDEQIQSSENLLLSFSNIKNEGKGLEAIFDRATQASVDLSAGGFGSMDSTAKQLGKALQDPVKGISALSRSGVTFTEKQKATIASLVETGDVLGAQKIILGEVEKQVKGSAEAQASAADKAQVAFGNLKEQIGTALLPVVDKLATFATDTLIPAISGFITELQNGTGVGGQVRSVLAGILAILVPLASFLIENKEAAATFIGVLAGFSILNKIRNGFLLLNAAMAANPIGLVVLAIAALAAGLVYAYRKSETFRNIVNGAFKAVGAAGRFLWNNVLQPAFKFIVNGLAAIIEGAADMLDALSHVPGFGWAKEAADKMHGAADEAKGLADRIVDIPNTVPITVTVNTSAINKAEAQLAALGGGRGRTIAGREVPGRTYGRKFGDAFANGVELSFRAKLPRSEEALEKLLDRMVDKLKSLKDTAKSLAESVASAFTQDAFSGGGLADFIKVTTGNIASLTAMKAALAQIKSFGASDSFIKALFSSGNTALISQLAAGGAGAVANAQSLFAQQNSLGAELGSSVSQTVLGDEIRGVRKEIRELRKDLRKAGRDNAREFARVLNGTAAAAKRSSNERLVVA